MPAVPTGGTHILIRQGSWSYIDLLSWGFTLLQASDHGFEVNRWGDGSNNLWVGEDAPWSRRAIDELGLAVDHIATANYNEWAIMPDTFWKGASPHKIDWIEPERCDAETPCKYPRIQSPLS